MMIFIRSLFLALALACFGGKAEAVICPYTPSIGPWYWSVQGSSPGTQVWSSASGSFVVLADATYTAWLAAGCIATSIDTAADLNIVLNNYATSFALNGYAQSGWTGNQNLSLAPASNTPLTLPLQRVINASASGSGATITMPQANLLNSQPQGFAFATVIENTGGNAFGVKDFGASTITSIPAGGAVVFVLVSNSSQAGGYITFGSYQPSNPAQIPYTTFTPIAGHNILCNSGGSLLTPVACPPSTIYCNPNIQVFNSGSGTYTTPTCNGFNPITIELFLQGGGGGGAGSGTSPGATTAGGDTCWNTTGAACTMPVYDAGGGAAGVSSNFTSAAGGTVSGSGSCSWSSSGGTSNVAIAATAQLGGAGGSTALAAGAYGGNYTASTGAGGINPVASSGVGGGGASSGSTSGSGSGGGGGASCFVVITSPAATYTYAVGSGGTGGTLGTGGAAGSGGASGTIRAVAKWQ